MKLFFKYFFLLVLFIFLVGCSKSYKLAKYEKKGLLTKDLKDTFYMVTIWDIKVKNEISYCEISSSGCNKKYLMYYNGDLSDYSEGDYVVIDIEGENIKKISKPWATTWLTYGIFNEILPDAISYYLAKIFGIIFLLLIIMITILGKKNNLARKR